MEVMLKLIFFAAVVLTCAGGVLSVKRCSDCGSMPVPYPLSTGPTCGDQAYKVRCNGGALVFDSLNNSYAITSIDPENLRLVIRPGSLVPNTCSASDLPHQGIQLNSSLPFNATTSNTIMLFNCTDSLLRSPLNCTSSSLCHSYVRSSTARDEGMAACQDTEVCCTFRAGGSLTSYSIRVQDSGCRAYTSFVNLNPNSPTNQWPDPGVEIQWVPPREPPCVTQTDCDDDENSICGPDPTASGVSRCFCKPDFLWDPVRGICAENAACQNPDGCVKSNRTALIAGLTTGIGATVFLVAIATLLYKRHRHIAEAQETLTREREEILNASSGGKTAKVFTGKEIKRATDNFSKDRLLGAGGYGEVYKGILRDGTVVAVKCAKLGNSKGTDQILNEVRILCQVNHRSLVSLLGCCVELEQPIMVYEFIVNGTLFDRLHGLGLDGRGLLSWTRRLQIAYDTAEGLAYLHSSAVPPIYHRDVKSSNILLDEKLNAKVSDFGLSRLAQTDLSHISTCAQGTLGYLDPEYYRNYQLTDKSDVYSFGIVLLELLTSQKAIDFNRDADDVNLAVYVKRMVDEERLMEVIDPLLKEKASSVAVDTMKALAFLALGCLEERRQNRPPMKEIAEEIEYIISIATARV